MSEHQYYYAVGRRKTAIAQVRLYPGGDGTILVNNRPLQEVFSRIGYQEAVLQPLRLTGNRDRFKITVKVAGGGLTGWTDAIKLGIARALIKFEDGLRPLLRERGLLTRDPRAKERQKYGLKRARKAPQYTKR